MQTSSFRLIHNDYKSRQAVSLFLCLLRFVVEMRSVYKGFYSTAINTARAGKMTRFPADIKTYS